MQSLHLVLLWLIFRCWGGFHEAMDLAFAAEWLVVRRTAIRAVCCRFLFSKVSQPAHRVCYPNRGGAFLFSVGWRPSDPAAFSRLDDAGIGAGAGQTGGADKQRHSIRQ